MKTRYIQTHKNGIILFKKTNLKNQKVGGHLGLSGTSGQRVEYITQPLEKQLRHVARYTTRLFQKATRKLWLVSLFIHLFISELKAKEADAATWIILMNTCPMKKKRAKSLDGTLIKWNQRVYIRYKFRESIYRCPQRSCQMRSAFPSPIFKKLIALTKLQFKSTLKRTQRIFVTDGQIAVACFVTRYSAVH